MTVAHHVCPPLLSRIPADKHAVIEASAGTGKTYTIEHLVVDRVVSGVPLDEILVVTFTEKATGELRARIRQLVTDVLATPPNAEPEKPHWRIDAVVRQRLEDALFAFDRAPIYTIHGFCHRVLSDMAFESGQLFELEIIDSHRAFNRAWREALRSQLAKDKHLSRLLRTWLESQDENALERLLFQARQQRYLDGWVPLDERLPRMLDDLRDALDVGAYV
ncbi:MAG: exodeoxyribonuclease V beta subunit, partial [Bradymonadia bacterium]